MTKQEFMRQVWRPYDSVEIDGGMRGRVTTVCFPTRSVKVRVNDDVQEWFDCEMITSHISASGQVEDIAIIEELHNKLILAEDRNKKQQKIINEQNEKIAKLSADVEASDTMSAAERAELKKLRKAINKVSASVDSIMAQSGNIDAYLLKLGIRKEDEE